MAVNVDNVEDWMRAYSSSKPGWRGKYLAEGLITYIETEKGLPRTDSILVKMITNRALEDSNGLTDSASTANKLAALLKSLAPS